MAVSPSIIPRFSESIRKSPSRIYQLLSAAFTAPWRVIRYGCAPLDCDPFSLDSKQSILSFSKQYLNYVDNYGKEFNDRNVFSPKAKLPPGDILIMSECRLYDGVDMETSHRVSRVYRFFLGIKKFILTYSSAGDTRLFLSCSAPGGEFIGRERFLRIISDKIVDFWSRYDYNRLVDFIKLWRIPMIRIWLILSFVTILFVMISLFLIRKHLIVNYLLFVV